MTNRIEKIVTMGERYVLAVTDPPVPCGDADEWTGIWTWGTVPCSCRTQVRMITSPNHTDMRRYNCACVSQ
jgi:hypothetical protein